MGLSLWPALQLSAEHYCMDGRMYHMTGPPLSMDGSTAYVTAAGKSSMLSGGRMHLVCSRCKGASPLPLHLHGTTCTLIMLNMILQLQFLICHA